MKPGASSGLDPLCATLVRLFAVDLLSVQQHPHLPGCFVRKGRPVKEVEVVGVVVSVDRRESYLHLKLDDGTGCIPCILWTNHHTSAYFTHLKAAEREQQAEIVEAQARQVRLGRLFRVQGKISIFRTQIQVTVSSLVEEKDPNFEVLHWMQSIRLALQVYDVPFTRS